MVKLIRVINLSVSDATSLFKSRTENLRPQIEKNLNENLKISTLQANHTQTIIYFAF